MFRFVFRRGRISPTPSSAPLAHPEYPAIPTPSSAPLAHRRAGASLAPARVLSLLALLAVASTLFSGIAEALPLYTAREGRACDNCHLTPNRWENPQLSERKCTMSCASCHVDPSGGGLRNTSGRFFGRSTLPLIATSPRPTQDWDRAPLPGFGRRDRATTYTDSLPEGPANFEESRQWPKSKTDRFAWGRPLGHSKYSLLPGRYGNLNSDPLLRVGYDFRLAAILGSTALAFPMQADIAAALQPVEHLTVLAQVGARGRTTGFNDVLDDPSTPALREGYILLHEAPFLSYAKAGRFVPSFGLRLDDHTTLTRRTFGLDGALLESRVAGVEVGVNPNYPFAQFSWFRGYAPEEAPPAFEWGRDLVGHGFAGNAGYRAEGWSLGASHLLRRRPRDRGGNEANYAVYGSLNPWKWWRSVPLTYSAEVDVGERDRAGPGSRQLVATYQELNWQAGNGVELLLEQDFADPDRDVIDDESWRVGGGIKVTPIPGVTFDGRLRLLVPAGDAAGADLFLQVHLWN